MQALGHDRLGRPNLGHKLDIVIIGGIYFTIFYRDHWHFFCLLLGLVHYSGQQILVSQLLSFLVHHSALMQLTEHSAKFQTLRLSCNRDTM